MERTKGLIKFVQENYSLDKLLLCVLIVGAIGHFLTITRPITVFTTPFILIPINLYLFYVLLKKRSKRLQVLLLLIFLISFLSEVIGVATGKVFGEYYYSNVLGQQIFGVPIIIGLMWTNLIIGAVSISSKVFKNPVLIIFCASILTTLLDFILEPIAIKLNYWQWVNGIPLQNYIAWFVITFVCSALYFILKCKLSTKEHEYYFWFNIVFFIVLRVLL